MSNWKWTEDDRLFSARHVRMARVFEPSFTQKSASELHTYFAETREFLAETFRVGPDGFDAHDGGPPEQALNHFLEFTWADMQEMMRRADRGKAVAIADYEQAAAAVESVENAMLDEVEKDQNN